MKKLLIVAFLAISIFAGYGQSFTLLGTVVNENDQPMKGVTVYVKEKDKNEIFTNSDGWFKLPLSDTTKQKIVVFSFSGYQKQEYRVNPEENDIRIVMKEGAEIIYVPEGVEVIDITEGADSLDVPRGTAEGAERRYEPKVTAEGDTLFVPIDVPKGTGALTGTIKDKVTGETIPFANVAVMTYKGKIVTGGHTDFDGKYTLKVIPVGTYTVQISCIGYYTQQLRGIVIDADKKVQQNITLKPNAETMETVEIVDYKVSVFESIALNEVSVDKKTKRKFPKDGTATSGKKNIKSGTLTSGEVNDFAKWHLWDNVLNSDFQLYTELWGFFPVHRYITQLTNQRGMPLANAQVTLQNSNGEALWRTKTDNTGKAELWIDFFKSETKTDMINLKLVFEYEGQTAEITNVTPFKRGINTAQIDVSCHERNKVDIFFMVDATGSMGDEIRYLQVELEDIIRKIHKQQSELQLRVGALVYRDHGDEYLTRKSSLNSDINETLDFLRKQSAGGGGDYPEAVDMALYQSITNEDWDDDALARILFIVLDAPSHTQPEVLARLESQLRLAAEKGIRIVPIACSDIKKDGEYLMRTFALATNGTYLFLTDDSGVGNAHIKPSTDKYDVEKLNDAMVRVVKQYTKMPDCNNPKWAEQNKNAEPSDKFVPNPYDEKAEEDSDKLTVSDIIKVYPNPCRDILKIELKKSEVKDIYIVDVTGKTLYGFNAPARNVMEVDVNRLSTGIYFVKVFYRGRWFGEKFIKI